MRFPVLTQLFFISSSPTLIYYTKAVSAIRADSRLRDSAVNRRAKEVSTFSSVSLRANARYLYLPFRWFIAARSRDRDLKSCRDKRDAGREELRWEWQGGREEMSGS